jgi:hypothetical protein
MRNTALIPKSIALTAFLVAMSVLGRPDTASATGAIITPSPSTSWIVQGTFYTTGITLAADIDSSQIDFAVSHNYVLHEGWLIKVNSEYMTITQIIHGHSGNPDILLVLRGQNGSTAAPHASGTPVLAQAITISILANNVSDPEGLGGFTVYMKLPPEVRYGQMIAQTAWLESTGRSSWCDGPVLIGDNWSLSCATLGSTPPGPNGSGLIATVTLLPLQNTVGISTVDFSDSILVDTAGNQIPATVRNFSVRILQCPDTNLDNWVDSGDAGQISRNLGDRGQDSGATLTNALDASQASNIAISDQSLLAVGDTIAVDAEQMTVQALHDGSPDTIDVIRGVNATRAASHAAAKHIFKATLDGNLDGKKGYTDPRDVNDDTYIDSGDYAVVARTMVTVCPAP